MVRWMLLLESYTGADTSPDRPPPQSQLGEALKREFALGCVLREKNYTSLQDSQ